MVRGHTLDSFRQYEPLQEVLLIEQLIISCGKEVNSGIIFSRILRVSFLVKYCPFNLFCHWIWKKLFTKPLNIQEKKDNKKFKFFEKKKKIRHLCIANNYRQLGMKCSHRLSGVGHPKKEYLLKKKSVLLKPRQNRGTLCRPSGVSLWNETLHVGTSSVSGGGGQGTNPLYPTTKMWTEKQKNRGRQKRKEREKMGRKGRERKGKGEGDGEREGGRARLHIWRPPPDWRFWLRTCLGL